MLDAITDVLQGGGEVNFTGFGKFARRRARPSPGRQPAHRRADHHPGRQGAPLLGRLGAEEEGQGRLATAPFADRLAALVEERRSQVCLGLDPDPAALAPDTAPGADLTDVADRAAAAIFEECRALIETAGPACVAVKPQLACFERLGAPGWGALAEVCARGAARRACWWSPTASAATCR